ncbi:MAG: hypothetical protein GF355_14035 [Candidatus Eisenbacteria bacterium]|nr:hypothetical protein [Candidatus Eisenbacteria bacterium]
MFVYRLATGGVHMRKALVLAMAACFCLAGPLFAFHDGGVAHCNGCHTMHNSQDGELVDPDNPNGNPWLLIDATPSDVCLSCHADHLGAVFYEDPLNPATERGAGNFIFLLEDNINDGHAGGDPENWIPGDAAGHNIVAPGHGVDADGTLTTAPGGTFPSTSLGCSSCHDPHGNDAFRLLYGVGPIQDGLYTFTNDAPDADGLSIFGGGESNSNHTAYKSGMSDWCANCHGDFHSADNPGKLIHPTGETLGGTIANAYNLYNGTDDPTGGDPSTAYLAAVPFEDPGNTTGSTAGPSASSQVTCMSCHRAHATSAPDAGRWDFSVTFLHEDGVESGSYPIPDPYSSDNQRSLCNKCHVKDANDAPFE